MTGWNERETRKGIANLLETTAKQRLCIVIFFLICT